MAMTLTTRYACCDDRRRIEVDASAFNGIDFLEVLDPGVAAPQEDRQRTLFVHFVKDPTPLGAIGPDNIVIEGGDRVRDVRAVQAQVAVDPRSGSTEPILIVEVDNPGDHSTYTLRLVPTAAQPLDTVDVGSQISGQVTRVLVDFNDEVRAGQPLAVLDPQTYQSRVAQSQADIAAGEAAANPRAQLAARRIA